MTQIHGRHLQCNKCYRHYFQSHLFSYYHSGLEEDANESKLARFIYSPNCKSCNSKDYTVIGSISGKIRKNNIKIMLGDVVDLEMTPYDLHRGRIVYRYK